MVLIYRAINRSLGLFAKILAAGALLLAFGGASAFAIPSPELVVGSFSSISQLFALGSALLGGGAATMAWRANAKIGRSGVGSRFAILLAFGTIAVLTVTAGGFFYLYMDQRAQERERLESALLRPMPDADGKSLDPDLKEASYGDQQRSPRGISTEDLEKLLEAKSRGERSDVVLLDIREKPETEMGSLPGSVAIRFPDLPKANLDLKGKTAVLFCHNGNRSYETCQAMAARGIDCRFMVGGLEKWLVEDRSLTGLKARTLDDLRAIPSYPNQSVLLNTREVHKLVDKEKAIFVDVRYPGEFAAYHLPGAINIPIRPTPTDELKAKLAQVPHRPVIAPCYDRRSCFFGEVIGLELTRAGYDFRGRYTVPQEYFTPTPPRPYIQQWLEEAHRSWWTKAAYGLADVLSVIADRAGLIFAIVLLALLSRFLVLPVSLKAERDQIVSNELSGELDALKARLKEDPRQLARAMQKFYRDHGLTPMRNLIALLFLPIMAMSITAVHKTAAGHTTSYLWISDMSAKDPLLVLPVLFAVLIALYLDIVFARTRMQRLLTWGIAIPVLTATGALLSAAADIYVIVSAILLLVQRAFVSGQVQKIARAVSRYSYDREIIALEDTDRLSSRGNKAYRLSVLKAHGICVPDGVILTSRFLSEFAAKSSGKRNKALNRIWRLVGGGLVAVRSSAAAEDGQGHSFAGIFESVLNVNRASLESAITDVASSFEAERARSYGVDGGSGNIIIQKMVEAEFAGVLFTRDPAVGGASLVEMVRGTGQSLVAGTVAPETYRCGRLSGQPLGEVSPPIDLAPLIALGQQTEKIFGRPQDVEWTYLDNQFVIVQSRDITHVLSKDDKTESLYGEQERILDLAIGSAPGEIVFSQNELAEMLPRPTPLSLSLMESLWAPGGSVDRACNRLGLSYAADGNENNYLVTVFGRLYIDKRQEKARAVKMSKRAVRRLTKAAGRIERKFRDDFLPDFSRTTARNDALDFAQLPTADLLAFLRDLRDRFTKESHVEVDVINIAAALYLDQAKQKLVAQGFDPAQYLSSGFTTDFSRCLSESCLASGESRRTLLLTGAGHRAVLDYELAKPRYAERPELLEALCESQGTTRHKDSNDPINAISDEDTVFAVQTARRFQTLKENAKHHSLRELAIMRRALLTLDGRFLLDGLVFYLTFDELLAQGGAGAIELRDLAQRRHRQAQAFRDVPPLPQVLTAADIERALTDGRDDVKGDDSVISGTRVSGSGVVEGRARVISAAEAESGDRIRNLHTTDIVVSSIIHPAWLPDFRSVTGFICEIGGWLSHTAVVAREYDLPMIVATKGLRMVQDGDLLRLHPSGIVEIVSKNRKMVPAE